MRTERIIIKKSTLKMIDDFKSKYNLDSRMQVAYVAYQEVAKKILAGELDWDSFKEDFEQFKMSPRSKDYRKNRYLSFAEFEESDFEIVDESFCKYFGRFKILHTPGSSELVGYLTSIVIFIASNGDIDNIPNKYEINERSVAIEKEYLDSIINAVKVLNEFDLSNVSNYESLEYLKDSINRIKYSNSLFKDQGHRSSEYHIYDNFTLAKGMIMNFIPDFARSRRDTVNYMYEREMNKESENED